MSNTLVQDQSCFEDQDLCKVEASYTKAAQAFSFISAISCFMIGNMMFPIIKQGVHRSEENACTANDARGLTLRRSWSSSN